MASPKHPENFVSYRASTVSLSSVVTDFDRVQRALDLSTTAVDRANLRSHATLLRIQAAVTEGDEHSTSDASIRRSPVIRTLAR